MLLFVSRVCSFKLKMILILLRLIALMAAHSVTYKKKLENISNRNRVFAVGFKKISIVFNGYIIPFFDFLFKFGPIVFLALFLCFFLLTAFAAFFLFNNLSIVASLILNCFIFYVFLFICYFLLAKLSLMKTSFKVSNGLKIAAASGFCIHT